MCKLIYKGTMLLAFVYLPVMIASAQDVAEIKSQKPFSVSGTIGVGIGTYGVSGVPSRAGNFPYLMIYLFHMGFDCTTFL